MVLYYVCTWAIHDVIGSLCNACASETRLITINYDLKVCTSFCSARHACRFDNLASDLHHNILWIRNSTKKSHKVQLNGVKLLNSEQNTNFFFIAPKLFNELHASASAHANKTSIQNFLIQNNAIQLSVRSGSRSSLIAITVIVGGLGVAHVLPSSISSLIGRWGSIVPCL